MQVEYKTGKGTVCFQKVKDKHTNFELAKLVDYNPNDYLYLIADVSFTKMPPGKWQLIGLICDINEEQAKMMVDKMIWGNNCFKNYNLNQEQFIGLSPLDSFKSLMQHLQIYEANPLEEPNIHEMGTKQFIDKQTEYLEAQHRTGKWVVLFKGK